MTLHLLTIWKMSKQIDELRRTMEDLKATIDPTPEDLEYAIITDSSLQKSSLDAVKFIHLFCPHMLLKEKHAVAIKALKRAHDFEKERSKYSSKEA